MRFVRRLLLSVVAIALLAACGDNATHSSEATTPVVAADVGAPGAAGTTPAPGAVPESLAFSAPQVGGGAIDMAGFAGKPVLLWFWAPT